MRHSQHPKELAAIYGGKEYPLLNGVLKIFQGMHGVIVEVSVVGLPETATNFFALHIHEGTGCLGEGFLNSGGHFDLGSSDHPRHAGDLPPLLANHGKAYMKVFTDRFRAEDVIGKTVIIHHDSDDFRSQPSGNAGAKIACGVILKE